jgi:hypothetical protein
VSRDGRHPRRREDRYQALHGRSTDRPAHGVTTAEDVVPSWEQKALIVGGVIRDLRVCA